MFLRKLVVVVLPLLMVALVCFLLPLMDGTEPRGPGGLRLRRRYYIAVATKQASPDYRSEVWPPIVKR